METGKIEAYLEQIAKAEERQAAAAERSANAVETLAKLIALDIVLYDKPHEESIAAKVVIEELFPHFDVSSGQTTKTAAERAFDHFGNM